MEQKVIVVDCDGSETLFDTGCNINFDRDRLLITVNTPSVVSGWHWDRFVCLIQHTGTEVEKPVKEICDIALRVGMGAEKRVKVDHFQAVELQAVNRILVVKGQQESALVNIDYMKWYNVHI